MNTPPSLENPRSDPKAFGARGEWYLVVQGLLIVLVAAGPRTWRGWPPWSFPDNAAVSVMAYSLFACGAALLAAALAKIGRKITPLPYPPEGARLRETGAYGIVRHPMYLGVILIAVGWALWRQGWLTLFYSVLVFAFLDIKARREERWLCERFPGYGDYMRRVRKLIPFIY